ncbi:hypothetical protein AVEN_136985-1 [Araneus ventricosus]|uniref:Uncharacterized protein n=1 Tax=Araneus ventricosus TaxID=182803 RepID=A0A4Y2VSL4_ARAVE|nr:hypothetical protein AVEN_136985-1 [Araneus ventricosus]
MQSPALCTTCCQRCEISRIPEAVPLMLMARMERSIAVRISSTVLQQVLRNGSLICGFKSFVFRLRGVGYKRCNFCHTQYRRSFTMYEACPENICHSKKPTCLQPLQRKMPPVKTATAEHRFLRRHPCQSAYL